jgi:bacteriocin-like protein
MKRKLESFDSENFKELEKTDLNSIVGGTLPVSTGPCQGTSTGSYTYVTPTGDYVVTGDTNGDCPIA